ncbi:MAG: hypothetical protein JG777_2281 [Clostridia bacterium]|nr:hypothetical protein [Clostridia bacterium]
MVLQIINVEGVVVLKKIFITLISTIVIILTMLFIHYIDMRSVVNVKVYTVKETGIVSSISSSGKVEEVNKAELFAEYPVRVKDIKVREGDKVGKDQPLVELELQELELQLEQAKANLEIEKLNFEKIIKENYFSNVFENKQQEPKGNIQETWNERTAYTYPGKDIINVYQKKIEIAQLEVQELEKKLQQQPKVLKSPITGIITAVNVKKGSVTNSLQPIITISDIDNLQVKVNIGEYYISKIKEGQKVEITGDAFEGICYSGRVQKISPIAKQVPSGQSSETVIELTVDVIDENTVLKPGYSTEVKIITDTKDNTLILPYEAIVQDSDNNDIVYVVKDNRAYKRKVVTGAELELEIEILEGLKKGEKVILNPPKKIKDGTKVRIAATRKR